MAVRPGLLGDERLARSVARGDEGAFATIYDRYHQRLYRYCYSLLRDREDAYDALQSTLANAFAALQAGRRDAPLRPWLFRIAHNEAITVIRLRGRDLTTTDVAESCVPSAEDRAGERARLALLVKDLHELPERQRSALLMRELSGLSYRDIAIAQGISAHTVKHALFAARRSLGEFEEGRAMVCDDVRRSISYNEGRLPPRARAHLRDCAHCAAFAAAIPARRADLQLLAAPLAPILATGLLAGLGGAASAPGAGGGLAAGVASQTMSAAFAAKALVGIAILASAGAGVAGAVSRVNGAHAQPTRRAVAATHARRASLHRSRTSGRLKGVRAAAATQPHGAASESDTTPVATSSVGGEPRYSQSSGTPATAAAASVNEDAGRGAPGGKGSQGGSERSKEVRSPSTHDRRSPAGAEHGYHPHGASNAAEHMRGSGGSPVAAAHRQNTGSVTPTSHGGQSDERAEARPAQGDSHAPATSDGHERPPAHEPEPAHEPAPASGGEPTQGQTPAGRPAGEKQRPHELDTATPGQLATHTALGAVSPGTAAPPHSNLTP
ncbi:MAG TPA: sigma-70 family RNA polymerase sigma factor [Solirubrobacteraceae bacterium]|nr:sigma-70 family RNA polymerase sigma factor [Solirubrobacteraceae bacterium]